MQTFSSHFYAATAYLTGGQEPMENATASTRPPIENPNNQFLPMVPAPLELVGAWTGSNCGLNDDQPVEAKLEMAENGVNIWYFQDDDTDELMPQTGDGFEVIVGYQCIDVGRGYWWGKVDYSDVLWCNLFQVEEVESDEHTVVLSYTNLAYGGQGVGAQSEGACPTDLASLEPSMKPLQASFMRRILKEDLPELTCNVPAAEKGRVQPSHNSQFPVNVPPPDPFHIDSLTSVDVKRIRTTVTTTVTHTRLPIINETTCRLKPLAETLDESQEENLDEEIDELAFSAGTLSNAYGIVFAAAITSIVPLL